MLFDRLLKFQLESAEVKNLRNAVDKSYRSWNYALMTFSADGKKVQFFKKHNFEKKIKRILFAPPPPSKGLGACAPLH